MVAGGHVWLLGVCMVARGMHGCWEACIVAGGCVWLLGGVCGCQGACMVVGGHAWLLGGACIGYDEIRSMSRRYGSYWNAYLLKLNLLCFEIIWVDYIYFNGFYLGSF